MDHKCDSLAFVVEKGAYESVLWLSASKKDFVPFSLCL